MCDELHELLARLGLAEGPRKVAGRGVGILLLYPTHLHAHMLRLDDDDDPKGIECRLDAVLDLHREALLHLQTTSEDVHDTWQLAQPRDVAIRDIADMHLPEEGEHVVLTEGIEVNILDDDHLPVVLFEHSRSEDLVGRLGHALGEEAHSLAHTLGGLYEAFTLGVFT